MAVGEEVARTKMQYMTVAGGGGGGPYSTKDPALDAASLSIVLKHPTTGDYFPTSTVPYFTKEQASWSFFSEMDCLSPFWPLKIIYEAFGPNSEEAHYLSHDGDFLRGTGAEDGIGYGPQPPGDGPGPHPPGDGGGGNEELRRIRLQLERHVRDRRDQIAETGEGADQPYVEAINYHAGEELGEGAHFRCEYDMPEFD